MVARHWLFRVSVAVNLFVVVYLALYSTSSSYTPSTAAPLEMSALATSSSNSNSNGNNELPGRPLKLPIPPPKSSSTNNNNNNINNNNGLSDSNKVETLDENGVPVIAGGDSVQGQQQVIITEDGGPGGDDSNNVNTNVISDDSLVDAERSSGNNAKEMLNNDSNSIVVKPERERLFPCDDLSPVSFFGQRGPFWVLYNYVPGTRQFSCDESITYTTHADYTFLDNLVPLLERWQGPVSLSLYSPGTDYDDTLVRIHYLRECSSLVRELVSFHLFFDHKHIPKNLTKTAEKAFAKMPSVNCSVEPKFGEKIATFKKKKKLPYPVNVARNVAREMAPTHYVLASDIELYPNPNLIPNFLEMIRRNDSQLQRPNPKLFVLPIFEVEANVTALPYDKTELQQMLNKSIAIPFHKYVCSGCHTIPKQKEWRDAKMAPGLHVFHIGKRQKPYHHWEPIYIGTKLDPMYDERLTWEGRSDKMTQVCINSHILALLAVSTIINQSQLTAQGVRRRISLALMRAKSNADAHIYSVFMIPLT